MCLLLLLLCLCGLVLGLSLSHGSSLLRIASWLARHLLQMLQMWWKLGQGLAHLLCAQLVHLLWGHVHAAHGVGKRHAHATLLLLLHLLRLLLPHKRLLLKGSPVLHHCRVHYHN